MTIEPFEPQSTYIVAGVGPYQIANPYGAGEITATIDTAGVLTVLEAGVDFTVSPESSGSTGNLTLSSDAALAHAGAKILIDRTGNAQQGWQGIAGSREKGLEEQLDAMARRLQEVQRDLSRAIRVTSAIGAFVAQAGKAIIFDDEGNPTAGPTASDIADAQTHAVEAEAARNEAEAARDAALAAENSMLEWSGAWATATAYAPSDIVRNAGSSYVCLFAHTSGDFSTDLAAGRWELFAQKGEAGAGTGDMLAANNLSDVASPDAALANLGGTTTGIALFKTAGQSAARTSLGLGAAALMSDSANANLAVDPTAVARRGLVDAAIDAAIASVASGPTAAQVAAIVGAYGDVGSVIVAYTNSTNVGQYANNTTVAGSSLYRLWNDNENSGYVSLGLAGTWRRMSPSGAGGYLTSSDTTANGPFLLVRIS